MIVNTLPSIRPVRICDTLLYEAPEAVISRSVLLPRYQAIGAQTPTKMPTMPSTKIIVPWGCSPPAMPYCCWPYWAGGCPYGDGWLAGYCCCPGAGGYCPPGCSYGFALGWLWGFWGSYGLLMGSIVPYPRGRAVVSDVPRRRLVKSRRMRLR